MNIAEDKARTVRLLLAFVIALVAMMLLSKGAVFAADKTCSITLDANGGIFEKNAPDEEGPTRVVTFDLDDNGNIESFINAGLRPKREGKTCLGWSTDKNATEAQYQEQTFQWMVRDDDNSDPKYVPVDGSVKTLYAVWTDTYTITLDANGGNLGTKKDRYGNKTPIETCTMSCWYRYQQDGLSYTGNLKPVKEGFVHKGWSARKDAVRPEYDTWFHGLVLNASTPKTLYAVYGLEGDTASDYVSPEDEAEQAGGSTDSGSTSPSESVKKTDLSKATVSIRKQTYTGKLLKPVPKVKLGTKTVKAGSDFTVTYKNNKNAGTATAVVKGTGAFSGSISVKFIIQKAANPLKVKPVSKTFKQKGLTKARSFRISVSGAKGKVSYKADKKAAAAKIKVAKNGKVTVPKKCRKGTYKITVKAAGNKNYKGKSKTVTVRVK